MQAPIVILRSGKDKSVRRFHPWVFSGAVKKIKNQHGKEMEPLPGTLVDVYSNHDEYLGCGHYEGGSIAVKMLTFEPLSEIGAEFWQERLQAAVDHRLAEGLLTDETANVCRLVHAEGDRLPGLIIDFYNGTAVFQAHSTGMHDARKDIAAALKVVMGDRLQAVYDKSAESLTRQMKAGLKNGYILGDGEGHGEVHEYGNRFQVNWAEGQKTGFFVDQRENRKLLASYSKGKSVLNTFCYTGGFSVAALTAGATKVHSVDSSKKAIALTDANVALNFPDGAPHESFAADTMDYLKDCQELYDIIILDPPAYAKHQRVKHNAVIGYKRLNVMGLDCLKPGGLLMTFSCSQVVDRTLFYNTLVAAAIEVGRQIRVVHHLSQPPDHPVNIFHPEGEYLKGLVLRVD